MDCFDWRCELTVFGHFNIFNSGWDAEKASGREKSKQEVGKRCYSNVNLGKYLKLRSKPNKLIALKKELSSLKHSFKI